MKGDFSNLRQPQPGANLDSVLHQQGRIFSDTDFNDARQIAERWRDQAARDVIGARIAAVPVSGAGGFHVLSAKAVGQNVALTLDPGRIWADGLLVQLAGPGPVARNATYFGPPVQAPAATTAGIADDVRDVVVLQVLRESLSAFQEPGKYLEPALGGPDTIERVRLALSYHLYRLKAGEDCQTIAKDLAGGPKGLLAVTLDEPMAGDGDCPVFESGGYRGFEHALCRVEIIRGPTAVPWFAFSRFNGGLVGRGDLNLSVPAKPRVGITHNLPAILHCGLSSFYVEIMTQGADGEWSVVYGAVATPDGEDLKLDPTTAVGALPSAGNVFFRLWDRREPILPFTVLPAQELGDGIHLHFDSSDAAKYEVGDYWTFAVRAGEISNPLVLVGTPVGAGVTGDPPQGPERHRVALAEIHWTAAKDTTVSGMLEDCRKRFRPLTNLKVCCTFLIGDGVTSFGDFDSLEDAAAHLPPWGGKLCLLPGIHFANLAITGRANIFIHGCRGQTYVLPRLKQLNQPIIAISDCHAVEVEDLTLIGLGAATLEFQGKKPDTLRDVTVRNCRVLGIEHALRVTGGSEMEIIHNLFLGWDREEAGALVSIAADDVLIEDNLLRVFPHESTPPLDGGDGPHDSGPSDPCADLDRYVGEKGADLVWNAVYVLVSAWMFLPPKPYRAQGGLHLRPGCDRVRVLQNTIRGGQGHGITLGGKLSAQDAGPAPAENGHAWPDQLEPKDIGRSVVVVQDTLGVKQAGVAVTLAPHSAGASATQTKTTLSPNGDATFALNQGSYQISVGGNWKIVKVNEFPPGGQMGWLVIVEALDVADFTGFLHEIEIRSNDIHDMGLAGIGCGQFAGQPVPSVKPPAPPDLKSGTIADKINAVNAFLAEMLDSLVQQFLVPRDLVHSTSPVADLLIADNHIHGCVQNPYGPALRQAVEKNGLGGIALGLVDGCTIAGNRVLDNGRTATDPVCGIYVGHADGLELVDNHVSGNGPLTEDYESAKLNGIRGGIFVRYAGTHQEQVSHEPSRHPAVRVHDNRVDQPAGRALTLIAFGPASVTDNFLGSERVGRHGFIDQLVGGVLIADAGGLHRLVDRWFVQNLNQALNRFSLGLEFPSGPVLMRGNQIRVGRFNDAILGVLAASADDVAFEGNQSLRHAPAFYVNTMLVATSVRATGCRFIEDVILHCQSLITRMLIDDKQTRYGGNITAMNQADHCITVLPEPLGAGDPWPTWAEGNQVADTQCQEQRSEEVQQQLTEILTSLLGLKTKGILPRTSDFHIAVPGKTVAAYTSNALALSRSVAQPMYEAEAARLVRKFGVDHPRTTRFAARSASRFAGQNAAQHVADAMQVRKAQAAGTGDFIIDGFVTDAAGAGQKGLPVQLLPAGGAVALASGTTGPAGYFSFVVHPKSPGIAQLASTGAAVRTMDAFGKEAARSPVVTPSVDTVVSTSVTLPTAADGRTPSISTVAAAFPGLREFYTRWAIRGTGAKPGATATKPTPSDPPANPLRPKSEPMETPPKAKRSAKRPKKI